MSVVHGENPDAKACPAFELSIVCLQCGLAVFSPWKFGTIAWP